MPRLSKPGFTRMRKRPTLVVAAAVLVVCVCGIALYALKLGFTEDLYFNRWSFAHLLFTPEIIDNLPHPQRIGAAEFYHSCGDGPKPMAEGVSFESQASKEVILNQFHEYLSRRGYSRDVGDQEFSDYQYSKGDKKFSFSIQEEGGKSRVEAREYYFF